MSIDLIKAGIELSIELSKVPVKSSPQQTRKTLLLERMMLHQLRNGTGQWLCRHWPWSEASKALSYSNPASMLRIFLTFIIPTRRLETDNAMPAVSWPSLVADGWGIWKYYNRDIKKKGFDPEKTWVALSVSRDCCRYCDAYSHVIKVRIWDVSSSARYWFRLREERVSGRRLGKVDVWCREYVSKFL